ncbi:ribosome-associated heat shock protein Hsp15 [Alteromonadaceae bacterium M269]|nr:ribosome-associated heat shock protein Hsp15 [Alteromonadaceae bacterium M269]
MNKNNPEPSNNAVRLDKWLWAARFFKTRAIAREMIQGGKVQYNGQRSKPSKQVDLGAIVTVPQGFDVKHVVVEALSDQRRNATIAQMLYEETPESLEQREKNKEARRLAAFHSPKPDNRPDKKQRRSIIRFKQQ